MLDVSRIDPWILLEDAQRPEHAREDVGLGPWLAGAVHRDLDGLVVRGDQNCKWIEVINL